MERLNDPSIARHACGHRHTTAAVRSYRQIAAILVERDGISISPKRVKKICGAAERKFARGLLADPVIREELQASAAHTHQAMPSRDTSMHRRVR